MHSRDERARFDGRPYLAAGCVLALLLGTAVLFRIDGLGNVPGVNGDEAWMGVQAESLLHGESVQWRTPTGNLLNPFHFAPQVVLHAVGEPSIARLRTTALVSSLLAIGLNFWLASRVFDLRVAILSSALLTLLPINIAYARFAWDASQSVLFTLPVVYLPLLALRERRLKYWLLAAICFVAALLVHPTNIFVAPMLLAPVVVAVGPRAAATWRHGEHRLRLVALMGIVCVVTMVSAVLLRSWLQVAAGRMFDLAQWRAFSVLYLDFLSGTTIYRFVSGTSDGSDWAAAVGRLLVLGVLCAAGVGFARQWKNRDSRKPSLWGPVLWGYAVSLLGFFLIAGPEAIQPHYERYAMVLIPGLVVLVSVGLQGWLFPSGARSAAVFRWSALAVAALWLTTFHLNYLSSIRATGGESHLAFRTAGVDPKEAALREIVASGDGRSPIVIVAGQWWNYWPLKYLAYRYPHVEVIGLDQAEQLAAELVADDRSDRIWFVEFHGSPQQLAVQAQLRSSGFEVHETTFNDYGGAPVVGVLQPRAVE